MHPAKRRSVEKRREISRCAARSRREKESDIFTDLYVTVPIVEEPKVTHVDRIAVLRLAASLCRFRQVANQVLISEKPVQDAKIDQQLEKGILSNLFNESALGDSLNGFLLVVDSRSAIIYISPNVSRCLGLTQTDLVGQNLNDFLHPDDVSELKENFERTEDGAVGKMLVRMKSVLGARGRNLNLRSALFKAISFVMTKHVVGNIGNANARKSNKELNVTLGSDNDEEPLNNVGADAGDDDDSSSAMNDEEGGRIEADSNYFFLHGSLISQVGTTDTNGSGTFITRHSMDMKFSYCQEKLIEYLGYDIKSLMGVSFYSLVHPDDLNRLSLDFKQMYKKGQVCTSIFRLIAKTGGFIWMTTEATVVTQGTRSGRGQHVVCVHQVVSSAETKEVLADIQQTAMPISTALKVEAPAVGDRWLFRSFLDSNTQCSPTSGNYVESAQRSKSSNSLGFEEINSPDDRSPPLLVGINEQSEAHDQQFDVFGGFRFDGVHPEGDNLFVPADKLATGCAQFTGVFDMYTALPDANVSPTEEMTGKLDDLSLLAPFVDSTELVTLDLVAGDLDVPLDFDDFNDISLDLFTFDNKAKSAAAISPGKQMSAYSTKEHLQKVDEVYKNEMKPPTTFDDRSTAYFQQYTNLEHIGSQNQLSEQQKANIFTAEQFPTVNMVTTSLPFDPADSLPQKMTKPMYKNEPCVSSCKRANAKAPMYCSNNLFGFAHDPSIAGANNVENLQQLKFPTYPNYEAPLQSEQQPQSKLNVNCQYPSALDGFHSPQALRMEQIVYSNANSFAPHLLVQSNLSQDRQTTLSRRNQYKSTIDVIDYNKDICSSSSSSSEKSLKALTSFTNSAASYPQRQQAPSPPSYLSLTPPSYASVTQQSPPQQRQQFFYSMNQEFDTLPARTFDHELSAPATLSSYAGREYQDLFPKKRFRSEKSLSRVFTEKKQMYSPLAPTFYNNPYPQIACPPSLNCVPTTQQSWPVSDLCRTGEGEPKVKRFKASSAPALGYIKIESLF